MDCIFCKIVNGVIPVNKIYENDKVVAFTDLDPKAPVHILIIPKEHIDSAADINDSNSAVMADIFTAAAKIAKNEGLSDGFRIVTNSGDRAGQSVKHLHFHVLGGRDMTWPPG